MLDYRFHYAVMAAEDRLRPLRPVVMTPRKGTRRIFRLSRAGTVRAGGR